MTILPWTFHPVASFLFQKSGREMVPSSPPTFPLHKEMSERVAWSLSILLLPPTLHYRPYALTFCQLVFRISRVSYNIDLVSCVFPQLSIPYSFFKSQQICLCCKFNSILQHSLRDSWGWGRRSILRRLVRHVWIPECNPQYHIELDTVIHACNSNTQDFIQQDEMLKVMLGYIASSIPPLTT